MYIILLSLLLLFLILFCFTDFNIKEGVDESSNQVQINQNTSDIKTLQNNMKELINLKQVIVNLTTSIKTSEDVLTNLNQKLDSQEEEYNQNVTNMKNGITPDQNNQNNQNNQDSS